MGTLSHESAHWAQSMVGPNSNVFKDDAWQRSLYRSMGLGEDPELLGNAAYETEAYAYGLARELQARGENVFNYTPEQAYKFWVDNMGRTNFAQHINPNFYKVTGDESLPGLTLKLLQHYTARYNDPYGNKALFGK